MSRSWERKIMSEDPEFKHQKRNRALYIHWGCYIITNLVLFIINYAVDYSYPWHLWPLTSWGLAILIHSAVVVITNIFERTLETRLALHGTITIITSAYLIWNDWFEDFRIQWMIFAVIPLTLLWLNHLVVYRLLRPKYHKVTGDVIERSIFHKMVDRQVERMAGDIEGDKRKAARKIVVNRIILRNHIIIYAAVNIFLFVVNIDYGLDSPWFLWPTLSWGVTILFHTFSYLRIKKQTMGQRISKKYLLVYPVTIAVYLVIIDVLSNSTFDWFWWAVVPLVVVSIIITQIMAAVEVRKQKKRTRMGSAAGRQTAPKSQVKAGNVHEDRMKQASRRFCPNCGKPVLAHHMFCQGCGYDMRS